ncbi:arrestin domain-containing protein 17-like [Periplaneta americana]|uniref:arrestin domain-containing protein 17-like n=1 Tax=Periplaneta americana TaxID=6978 RepID=UPI0037E82F04
MGLKVLKIMFNNTRCKYFSGDILSGGLWVVNEKPKKVKGIVIVIKGEGNCHLDGDETHGNIEKYFEKQFHVFGRAGYTEILQPGNHVFQFRMKLPYHLPPSFETERAYIRYTVTATVIRPGRPYEIATAHFTVLSHGNLSDYPQNSIPIKTRHTQDILICFCKSRSVTLETQIPANYYVPGEFIPVSVQFENDCDISVSKVGGKLMKFITYHSNNDLRIDRTILCKMDFARIHSNKWYGNILVPRVPPTMLRVCKLIKREYILKVKLSLGVYYGVVINTLPIMIGTVPLQMAQIFHYSPGNPAVEIPRLMSIPCHQMGRNFPHTPQHQIRNGTMTTQRLTPPRMAETLRSPPHQRTNATSPETPPPSYEECLRSFGMEGNAVFNSSDHLLSTTV